MKRASMLLILALAGCGEAVKDDHFAQDVRTERQESAPIAPGAVPVRVGELGPSFDACGAAGTTRNIAAESVLTVRAAPFDTAQEIGGVRADAQFFICARSHDQRWMGIVYTLEGELASCGVSSPVPTRRAYEGPCASGWVPSASVKLIAG